jgi:hypothetical protein
VQVPAAAVVYTGPRRLVFVDIGGGRFRPTDVQVGTASNGMYEVFAGVSPGDQVATSGVFLIAAEARISTAAKYWDSASEADAGAPPEAMPPGPRSPAEKDFTCPMHPDVHSPAPGKCPKCGMDLAPRPRQP